MSAGYDYVAVGHVTRDVIEGHPGAAVSQPGGGAFYSALQAARLGLRTLIVTQGVPSEIDELLAPYRHELEVQVIPAKRTTTLSTRGSGESRSQRVLAWAGPIVEPIVALRTAILHIAPVAREGRLDWSAGARFVGLTPQGLIRRWRPGGEMSRVALERSQLPARYDAAVFNERERAFCAPVLAAARDEDGPIVAVTAGPEPATVYLPGGAIARTAALASERLTQPRDDLGAGDVFAAAFFIALAEGRAPLQAAGFADAAAALRIAGIGPHAIGRRADVESLAKDALAG